MSSRMRLRNPEVAGHEIRSPADRAVAGGARAARQDCQDIHPPLSLVSVLGGGNFATSDRRVRRSDPSPLTEGSELGVRIVHVIGALE